MKKLQQFKIFKFSSDRLKDINFNLNISRKEGISNGEVVSLGESELIRIINRIKKIDASSQKIKSLLSEKKRLKRELDSKDNRKEISRINQEIENILFIDELVNIEFTDPRHYQKIIDNGLYVNGKKYVRLLTGAGMARRSTVQFVEEEFGKILKPILDNDRDKSVKLVDAKFNAYYALVSSASYPVTTPRFCVISDYEYEKDRLVDFVCEEEGKEDWVEERTLSAKNNVFDGQGIISLEFAKQWASDMGIEDYVPNSFCIRGAYLKGQCVAFDFRLFAKSIAKKNEITDIWGNIVDINNVDVILTASQLKLWSSYSSCKHYQSCCEKNGIGWGISRVNPKFEKDTFYTSYQLLQVLDLDKEQVENMCKPTVDWIKKVIYGDVNHSLLYLLGEMTKEEELKDNWFEKLDNWLLKAVLLNHRLGGDSYFKRNVHQSLTKKIKESKMGKIVLPGNWQVCISDPYAFCEHAFGMKVRGLLSEHEHYCQYWTNKGIDTVASGRSPLTWKSEMNVLHLQNDIDMKKWYSHIHSGVIFNIHGVDTMLMADGDFDYDICFTTPQKEFIVGASGGKPVTYNRKESKKQTIDEEKLYLADIRTMGSKIGFLTNMGTTFYSLLPLFDKESKEYKELINRLIIIRKLQGQEIDKAKSGYDTKIPKWDRWTKITQDMSEEEKEIFNFKNKIIANRRPKFMIYLYPEYMKKYKKHRDIYNNYCESIYGYGIDELAKKEDKSSYEEEVLDKYQEFDEFVDSNCIMGYVCRFMEEEFKNIRGNLKDSDSFSHKCMMNEDIPLDDLKLKKMKDLYKRYKNSYSYDEENELFSNKANDMRLFAYEKISSNGSELANLAVKLCYENYSSGNRSFCWQLFGEEIVGNILNNNYQDAMVPMKDDSGDIVYLGNKYSNLLVQIDLN